MSSIRQNKWIITILAIGFLKGMVWMILFPPFQTPDELSHFSYVQYVGETSKIPLIGEKADGFSKEQQYFMSKLSRPTSIAFNPDVKAVSDPAIFSELFHQKSNKSDRVSSGSTPASGYPPGYYGPAAIVYKAFSFAPIIVRFYAVRMFAVLLGLITVLLAYLIGKKLIPGSKGFGLTLAATTCFHPMFSMTSISINNDILMVTISTAVLYWLLFAITRFDKKLYIIGGLLIGIGLWVKAQMLYVLAVSLFILLVYLWKQRKSFKQIIHHLSYVIVPCSLVYHGWALFSWQQYDSLLGGMGFQPEQQTPPSIEWYLKYNFYSMEGLHRIYDLWVKMYWAKFGWLDTVFNSFWLYKFIAIAVLLSLIGAIMGIFRKKYDTLWLFLVFFIGNILFLYATEIQYYMQHSALMLQGRYLFTALIPLNIIIILGLIHIFSERYKTHVYYSLSIGMFAFNVASYILIYQRYYVGG